MRHSEDKSLEISRKPKKSSLKKGESKSEIVEDSTVHCFVWQDKKAVSFINTIFDVTDE